jgi:hypothetical protein
VNFVDPVGKMAAAPYALAAGTAILTVGGLDAFLRAGTENRSSNWPGGDIPSIPVGSPIDVWVGNKVNSFTQACFSKDVVGEMAHADVRK